MRIDPTVKVIVPLALFFVLSAAPLFLLCAASSEEIAATAPSTAAGPTQSALRPGSDEKIELDETYGRLPLHFIENRGQMDEKVRFYEKGPGHSTFFTSTGVLFGFSGSHEKSSVDSVDRPEGFSRMTKRDSSSEAMENPGTPSVVELTPVAMSRSVEIVAEDVQEGRVNYFIGKDPERWHTNVPTYRSVTYREAYAGVDLRFHGTNRQLEYDLILKPGADPSEVTFQLTGIEGLEVTKDGDLSMKLKNGVVLAQKKPFVYQVVDGKRVEREGHFRIDEADGATQSIGSRRWLYGFVVASYDRGLSLIIDPYFMYSTYLGGTGNDYAYGIAVDSGGNGYVTGCTESIDFPTMNPEQEHLDGGLDAFITKISPEGDALIYSTYIGGGSNDCAYGIALDSSANAYVTGYTKSSDFPVANAFQSERKGTSDAFVTKLNATGDGLVFSTYLGGSFVSQYDYTIDDNGRGIAVDSSGSVYVAGTTYSNDFPVTPNAFQKTSGGPWTDAFVTKFYQTGDALLYSTYLGGNDEDSAYAIAIDSSGNAYVTGKTGSDWRASTFPTRNAVFTDGYGFLAKLNTQGDDLIYSTFLFGVDPEERRCYAEDGCSGWGSAIALDPGGSAYVTAGYSEAWQEDWYNWSWVFKFSTQGDQLVYSKQVGSADSHSGVMPRRHIAANGIAVDQSGNAYVTGGSNSLHILLWNPVQPKVAGTGREDDVFIMRFSATGEPVYSSYLGGGGTDGGMAICLGPNGNAYIAGNTSSSDFPRTNPLQKQRAGASDVFIAQLHVPGPAKLTLIQPNGGEIWNPGSTQTIKWESSGLNRNVKIQISRDGGSTWSTLFNNLPKNGLVDWKVAGPPTPRARIRVRSVTTPGIQDASDNDLTIAGVQVNAPNGGEVWGFATRQTVRWNSFGVPGNVRIALSRDGGSSWNDLFGSVANSGVAAWKVTKPASTSARIKITSIDNPAIEDTSDNNFTLTGIQVTYPNGGELWSIGARQVIQWKTWAGLSGGVALELSRDGGKTWTTLLNSTENDGNQAWVMTGPATTQAFIRVKSMDYPATVFGRSKSVFTIQ